eukprot:TRINITY_DN48210_c0_g1_i1.p1 TRINITY_DN48210_c0_g1~~TRINITY_DN48210_c0_g1_i1.p1  ORF type:complete len:236 (+),score=47.92 TRINITY_DN48210_c0_g1_i1:27-734(+)
MDPSSGASAGSSSGEAAAGSSSGAAAGSRDAEETTHTEDPLRSKNGGFAAGSPYETLRWLQHDSGPDEESDGRASSSRSSSNFGELKDMLRGMSSSSGEDSQSEAKSKATSAADEICEFCRKRHKSAMRPIRARRHHMKVSLDNILKVEDEKQRRDMLLTYLSKGGPYACKLMVSHGAIDMISAYLPLEDPNKVLAEPLPPGPFQVTAAPAEGGYVSSSSRAPPGAARYQPKLAV